MTLVQIALLAIVTLVAVLVLRKKSYSDITVPAPKEKRKFYYGYYSCFGEQVAETKNHINLFMDSQFNGPEKAAQNIIDSGVDAMIDVSYQLFEKLGKYHTLRPDAKERLTLFFKFLASKGALANVKIIYLIDEPNNTVENESVLRQAKAIVREIEQSFFPNGVKYGCIYVADKPFMATDLFDFIGFDDYDKKSSILENQYLKLKAVLTPGQQTILVPGGAYGQDPTPFINFAHANPEVGMVLAFLWYDDTTGSVGAPGIRSGARKEAYIAEGLGVIRNE